MIFNLKYIILKEVEFIFYFFILFIYIFSVLFALPMMAGVAAGCFSSQFIAPNLFGMWQIHKRNKLDAAKRKA